MKPLQTFNQSALRPAEKNSKVHRVSWKRNVPAISGSNWHFFRPQQYCGGNRTQTGIPERLERARGILNKRRPGSNENVVTNSDSRKLWGRAGVAPTPRKLNSAWGEDTPGTVKRKIAGSDLRGHKSRPVHVPLTGGPYRFPF